MRIDIILSKIKMQSSVASIVVQSLKEICLWISEGRPAPSFFSSYMITIKGLSSLNNDQMGQIKICRCKIYNSEKLHSLA